MIQTAITCCQADGFSVGKEHFSGPATRTTPVRVLVLMNSNSTTKATICFPFGKSLKRQVIRGELKEREPPNSDLRGPGDPRQ